ncbi:hypothetical protein K450DRAFT_245982 [Umbelopsis ramanniana AG]|uniref:glucan endo-1,3-beta-D-glucosidase n=1 Tax=Umbelopsis ramanniana AG TaxID=1314678 RepID=A0AAD5HBZ6_UMBRA|nr:uncharacterized protein K450DRAFT_245982 [Umbelopsis ramanniana AG]KAI8578670.1 hypothetical protein K450DRAFT_245982 [Umbelopsis ramanniana AG]
MSNEADITSQWPGHDTDASGSTETIVSDSLTNSLTATTVVASAYSASSQKPSQWLVETQRYSKVNRIVLISLGMLVFVALMAGLVYWIVSFYAFPPSYSTKYSDVPYPKQLNTTIVKNGDLHQSFYGIGYTPSHTQYPQCGSTAEEVLEDIKVLSQLTSRLRIYGMDCNAANYTLMAINLLDVNMTTLLTLWVDGDESTYQRQKETLFQIIDEYGTSRIDGVSVGNEVLFRNKTAEPDLIQKMTSLREEFRSRQIYLNITTTDLANLLDPKVILAEDVVMANIHPYFGGVPIEDATNWTMSFSESELFKPARLARKSVAAIAEVGWPSRGVSNSDSVPSLTNLQTFVDDFVCHANKANVRYYYFEAFDEPWKSKENELEGSWGIMDENRNLKVRIPVC